MQHPRIYRQGDVLLIQADLPEGTGQKIPRNSDDRLVLAYGEITGHHHAITEPDADLLKFANNSRYLRVDAPVVLRHEEHEAIPLPMGIYKIVIQREYIPGPVTQYPEVAD